MATIKKIFSLVSVLVLWQLLTKPAYSSLSGFGGSVTSSNGGEHTGQDIKKGSISSPGSGSGSEAVFAFGSRPVPSGPNPYQHNANPTGSQFSTLTAVRCLALDRL
ncbi:hypothetical protein WN944_004368 [Citrus x changshan-huyou]|uniref:Uncharacterized protein n=1 Tax=Citrus x changshan-huyou TaxID=2935761 RepID=A0AAP0M1R9_9ROSI